MKQRPNQKTRRRSHRQAGIFMKGDQLREVILSPTKGFRERNANSMRSAVETAYRADVSLVIDRGSKRMTNMVPVKSNAPAARHNKSG